MLGVPSWSSNKKVVLLFVHLLLKFCFWKYQKLHVTSLWPETRITDMCSFRAISRWSCACCIQISQKLDQLITKSCCALQVVMLTTCKNQPWSPGKIGTWQQRHVWWMTLNWHFMGLWQKIGHNWNAYYQPGRDRFTFLQRNGGAFKMYLGPASLCHI